MRTVNVAELKNRLSTYLTYAKSGEVVIIRDRNLPLAKLIPFIAEDAALASFAITGPGVPRELHLLFAYSKPVDYPITSEVETHPVTRGDFRRLAS